MCRSDTPRRAPRECCSRPRCARRARTLGTAAGNARQQQGARRLAPSAREHAVRAGRCCAPDPRPRARTSVRKRDQHGRGDDGLFAVAEQPRDHRQRRDQRRGLRSSSAGTVNSPAANGVRQTRPPAATPSSGAVAIEPRPRDADRRGRRRVRVEQRAAARVRASTATRRRRRLLPVHLSQRDPELRPRERATGSAGHADCDERAVARGGPDRRAYRTSTARSRRCASRALCDCIHRRSRSRVPASTRRPRACGLRSSASTQRATVRARAGTRTIHRTIAPTTADRRGRPAARRPFPESPPE